MQFTNLLLFGQEEAALAMVGVILLFELALIVAVLAFWLGVGRRGGGGVFGRVIPGGTLGSCGRIQTGFSHVPPKTGYTCGGTSLRVGVPLGGLIRWPGTTGRNRPILDSSMGLGGLISSQVWVTQSCFGYGSGGAGGYPGGGVPHRVCSSKSVRARLPDVELAVGCKKGLLRRLASRLSKSGWNGLLGSRISSASII